MRDRYFSLSIEGDGVAPDTVDARDVLEVIVALESAAAVVAFGQDAPPRPDRFSLCGVKEACDELLLATGASMYEAVGRISVAVATDDYSGIPPKAQRFVREMWSKARSKSWDSIGFLPNGNGIKEAAIRADREILRPAKVSGPTQIYVKLLRVGGDPATAAVVADDGTRITAKLHSTSLARDLGHRLYEVVGLQGTATWDVDDWKIDEFEVDSILPFRDEGILAAFDALAVAAGDRWNEIDPDEHVRELRGR